MSLTGTLLSGVAGLKAQTNAMAILSDNISNVNTIGYKKSNATFSTLVVNSGAATTYSPGGVKSGRFALIDNQGVLQSSNRPLDIAITGNGFFAVNTEGNGTGENLYTRAGQFHEDNQGRLVNSAGMYLMGWALDQNGLISNVNQLVPVAVGTLNGVAVDTTDVTIGANLNSAQTLFGGTSKTTTAFGAAFDQNDDLGAAGPTLAAGDEFTITANGNTYTFIYDPALDDPEDFSTLAELANLINNTTDLTASITSPTTDARLSITSVYDMTFADVTNTPFADLFGNTTATAGTYDVGNMQADTVSPQFSREIQVFDSLGTAHDVTFGFIRVDTNRWAYELYTPDSEISGVVAGRGLLSAGTIDFNGDGSLNGVTTTVGSALYAGTPPTPQDITINWSNGASPGSMSFNLGTPGAIGTGLTDGLTQFASAFNVAFINQNGSAVGLRTGVSIDKDGYVVASFSNGATQRIYQIPVTTFADPTALESRNGNAFAQTVASGSFNWRIANSGGAGRIEPSSLESSNADLGDEFSNMIVTQRAYSANAKTITTADEMLDELLRIKR